MTPVQQTNYKKHQGNCLTACIASILDLPISAVPELCADAQWFHRLYDFCLENGFFLLYWRHLPSTPMLALNAYVILLLTLEGEEDMHAVVGKAILEEIITVGPRSDEQIAADFALADEIGTRAGDQRWAWKTEIVHDPNERGYPSVTGVSGYVMIGKQ